MGDNGSFIKLLEDHIVGQSSILGQTLSEMIGPESNLGIALNPEHTNGLANDIQVKVDNAIREQLDVQNEKSAISRFF